MCDTLYCVSYEYDYNEMRDAKNKKRDIACRRIVEQADIHEKTQAGSDEERIHPYA